LLGGELFLDFVNVLVMTLLVAPLGLWRYRRSVLDGMRDRPEPALPVPASRARPAGAAMAQTDPLGWERGLRRRVFLGVLGATAVPAVLLSVLYLRLSGAPMTPAHIYLKAAVLSSIAVPIFAVLTATAWPRALALWVLTLVALALGGVVLSMVQQPFIYGKLPSLDQVHNIVPFFQLAAVSLWLPALLGLATGARRVRGVAPLTFAALLVFGLAPPLGLRLTQWLTATATGTTWVISGVGIDTGIVLLALPIGLAAWWRVKRLARDYEAKRLSDALLLARTWWLLLVAVDAIELVSVYPGAPALAATLTVSVAAYVIASPLLAGALRRAFAATPRPAPRRLLLLRVFGDTARTEALFDRIGARWQLFGPVTMIAGPDVVARVVNPGDFLRFAAGRIGSVFINTAEDLQRRLAALDDQPDLDGRYRVEAFCCRDNTWQATVVELMDRADAVIMDLRGYDGQRLGCDFELAQLGARMSAAQVVLVVDAAAKVMLPQPLVSARDGRMQLVELGGGGASRDALFAALLRAAYGACAA
jgi:hypothetical protein